MASSGLGSPYFRSYSSLHSWCEILPQCWLELGNYYVTIHWSMLIYSDAAHPLSFLPFAAAIPLNKQLYTLSYVCVTSGAAALVFSAFYIMVCFFGSLWWILEIVLACFSVMVDFSSGLYFTRGLMFIFFIWGWFSIVTLWLQVDIWGLKYLFMPFKWIGMNAMLVYVMAAEGIFAGFINGWYYDDPHNTLVHSS